MQSLIKKLTVMIVTLFIFSVTTVAQTENSARSTNDDSYGVRVESSGELIPGEVRYYQITVLDGYDNPILIYNGENANIDTVIEGSIFTAKIVILEGGYFVRIEAYKDIKEASADTVYIKASQKYEIIGRSATQVLGAPLTITVNPNKK